MAYLDLNERAIAAMVSRFRNSLNGNIDLINAHTLANSSLNQATIDYPAQILDAPPIAGQLVSFPIVAVAEGHITFEDDVGWGATGVYDLVALAYVTSPDPQVLAWRLRRYAQALATTILFGREMDAGAWGVILKRIVPGRRTSRTDPNSATPEILSWVAVEFIAKDEQNTP